MTGAGGFALGIALTLLFAHFELPVTQPVLLVTTPAAPDTMIRAKPAGSRPAPKEPAKPAPSPSTQLLIPVLGIRSDQLRDTYSDARGSGRRHDAIDIMAPQGTPVIAAAPATVIKRDNGARGGIALYALGADNRTIYYYAHLDRYADGVVEGKRLDAGDVVGYVGDTGNAGKGNYHLHFEITTTSDPKHYWGGAPRNPFPALKQGITVRRP